MENEHYSVIIIGAGIAGCAAAKDLVAGGIDDIVILEASDRIGGRVNSIRVDTEEDDFIELGAQWVHGDEGNPLYDELAPHGLIEYRGEHLYDRKFLENKQFYDSTGHEVSASVIGDAVCLSDELNYQIAQFWSPGDIGIKEFKKAQLKNLFGKSGLSSNLIQQYMDILVWIDHHEQASDGYLNYDRSHLINDFYYDNCGGKNYVFLDGTFSFIESLLLPTIREKIQTDTEVINIDWSNDNAVKVTTRERTLTAKHVIFTPSLGFLKEHYMTLFNPSLPTDKSDAIKSLTFGIAEKSMLYFDEQFWTKEHQGNNIDFGGYEFISSSMDRELELRMSMILGRKATWWKAVSGLRPIKTNPHILMVWLSGENAMEANTYSDDVFTEVILTLLKHYTNISAPKPSKIMRTNWAKDRFFCGSYMSLTQDYRSEYGSNMLTPLYNSVGSPSLLFAGEAYHPRLMSSMPGAYETGRQQAQVILDYEY